MQAPDGEWFVTVMTDDLIYEGTHAAISLAYKKPCIDLLTPEPTARFLEVTHDRYAAKLGKDLGRYFVSTFTDEPSLQNLWFRPMPYRVLPWSLTFESEFQKRRGRALRPLLPALVTDAGPIGARARYDFWNTVGELVSENFFGQLNVVRLATTSSRRPPAGRRESGGPRAALRRLLPLRPSARCASIDCLTSLPPGVPWYIARMIGSIADLEGLHHTMCEVSDHSQRYRPKGDTRPIQVVTEDESAAPQPAHLGRHQHPHQLLLLQRPQRRPVASAQYACRALPDPAARRSPSDRHRRALPDREHLDRLHAGLSRRKF